MKWLICGLICMCVLAAPMTAYADLEKGTVAPDIEAKEWLNTDEPISLADYRGMVVVLFFWVSFHQGGQNVMTELNIIENHPALGKQRGMVMIGLTQGDRKRVEDSVRDEKVFFPVGCGSKSDEEYRVSSWPYMVVIDAEGRVAWSGSPYGKGNEVVPAIIETLNKTPPTRTHPQLAKRAIEQLEAAREALKKEDYPEAVRAAADAHDNALRGDPLKSRTEAMVDLIEAIARDQVASAERGIEEKRFDEAVKTLRLVVKKFRGTEAAKTAKARLEALSKSTPEVANLLKAQQGAARARGDIKKARDYIKDQRFGEAYELLQDVTEDHPGTDEAESAEELLGRLKKDDRVMVEVRNHLARIECRRLLAEARNLSAARRYVEARQKYHEILDKYGDTVFAKEATEELARMP
ncbi:MAG: redoxin domain-containing protein [Phycisphaerales bacterium]|nr:redoxin domain-containing protein [Phycisphaerales bacterium]